MEDGTGPPFVSGRMMRVLVTGWRGLLGGAMVREFEADPSAAVVGLDRRALDITDEDAVLEAVGAHNPNLIVNCAVFNGVDRAEDESPQALAVNAFGVQALARAANRAGAILVHFSSDFVFDGEIDRPYTEQDRPNPRSVYGASKLLGDWFALEYPRAYVLRVESVFGRPAADPSKRGSLATIVDRIEDGSEVPVFVDRVISPTHAADVTRAVRTLLETSAPFGLYHCVNSGHATWAEIAEYVASVLGKPMRSKPMTLATSGLRAKRPRYCALSNDKLVSAGVPMPPWRDAVREFLRP
jgi:dTDP-4-dehydrorhamnose reductase